MARRKRPRTWSYSVGERRDHTGGGLTVRVYEKTAGGTLYLATYDQSMHEGRGGYRRLSLQSTDRFKARARADAAYAELRTGRAAQGERVPTLGQTIRLYLQHHLDKMAAGTRRWLPRALESFVTLFGGGTLVTDLGKAEWLEYAAKRLSGEIDGNGQTVPADRRRPVRASTVCLCLDAITTAMNWATTYRPDPKGRQRFLKENPFERLKYPVKREVRRAVWTHDRYEKVLAAAEGATMQVEWSGKRREVRCYLADILVLSEETGRRIGAVRQLRVGDLRLGEKTDSAPFGSICWPAATDKKRKAWSAPISKDVRERLVQVLKERGTLGPEAYLFPAPRNADAPVDRETLVVFLRRAEAAAGVERLAHDSFHGLRRKWRSERRHLPDPDVARAGGWSSVPTMNRSYLQVDQFGVLEAILNPQRLREVQA